MVVTARILSIGPIAMRQIRRYLAGDGRFPATDGVMTLLGDCGGTIVAAGRESIAAYDAASGALVDVFRVNHGWFDVAIARKRACAYVIVLDGEAGVLYRWDLRDR